MMRNGQVVLNDPENIPLECEIVFEVIRSKELYKQLIGHLYKSMLLDRIYALYEALQKHYNKEFVDRSEQYYNDMLTEYHLLSKE